MIFVVISMKSNSVLRQLNNLKRYPLTVIVSIFLLSMLLGYVFGKQDDFSDVENRYLQKMPAISANSILDGSFMGSFETYTNEQIPLRDLLIKSKLVSDAALLKVENHGIAKGTEGYLFEKSTDGDAVFRQNLAGIDAFLKRLDKKAVVAFVPTSICINSDKLLKGTPVSNENQMNENAKKLLGLNKNAVFVDLIPVLSSHKDEQLYYRTDHHWNIYGAYYGYREIIKALGDEGFEISDYDINTYDGFYGTFYAKYQALGVKPDMISFIDRNIDSYIADDKEYDSIYDYSKLEIYDKYAMFMRGNYGMAVVDTKIDNDKELLVFKDSYANSLLPYLCDNYGTIKIIDLRYFSGSVKELLADNSKADILMLYNYSFLNSDRHFYKLTK